MRRLRGLKQLVHDAVDATTELVREGHESSARVVTRVTDVVPPIAEPVRAVDDVRRLTTDVVLASVRVVNRAVQVVTDAGLDLAEQVMEPGAETAVPMRSDALKGAPWLADAAIGLVNAAVGDHLHARGNGLGLGMGFRVGDAYVALDRPSLRAALPDATPKLALFVHGLGTTEWSWCLESERYHGDPSASFGTLLQRDCGYTPLFLRYNTGRHVSENGRALAEQLERLRENYPVPLEEILLVGHSMGGLVVRSACHYASTAGASWVGLVRRVFCLGSPHHGAPLEKLGHVVTQVLGAIDLPGTRIPARILAQRSAGIRDLRHGALVDEDWLGRDPDALADPAKQEVPLSPGIAYHFLSATITTDPQHPVGHLIGDLLVRVPSGSGSSLTKASFELDTTTFGGVLHHQIQNHPQVYAQILAALTAGSPPE